MSKIIITIGRQYGCGGREIGKIISEKLGIKYYDTELITLAAKKVGVDEEYYSKFDEKPKQFGIGIFSYSIPSLGYAMPLYDSIMISDKLFLAQANVIKEVTQDSCVIVGRCADYLLQDNPEATTVFLHADIETRKKHLSEKYGMPNDKQLGKSILKADKQRSSYYNTYTDKEWGVARSYDLCLNVGKIDKNLVADTIIFYAKNKRR